jgi:hypothetical protein
MIVSWLGARPASTNLVNRRANPSTLHHPAHQLCASTTKTAPEKGSGGRSNAATGVGRNGFQIRMRTIARTHLALTSSRPGHTRVPSIACTEEVFATADDRRTRTPLVGASALHGVSGTSSGSHLGSTLRPGGAVLTRGVSRRSGSVAYIRADASPTEVLARSSWHRNPVPVKQYSKKLHINADQTAPTGELTHGSPVVACRPAYRLHRLRSTVARRPHECFRYPGHTGGRPTAVPVPQPGRKFAMPFGISAVHLASAMRDNHSDRVATTELSAVEITAVEITIAQRKIAETSPRVQGPTRPR